MNSSHFTMERTVEGIDSDMHLNLRTSSLFRYMQEAATRHSEVLEIGPRETTAAGVMWIVTQHSVHLNRKPHLNEKICIETWPVNPRHGMCPRFYRLYGEHNELLMQAGSIWALADMQTRALTMPDELLSRLNIDDDSCGITMPRRLRSFPVEQTKLFTVPYSYIDINGHMNNTRYFDLAEDSIPAATQGLVPTDIAIEYDHEARCGEEIHLGIAHNGNHWNFQGDTSTLCFRLNITYAEKEA